MTVLAPLSLCLQAPALQIFAGQQWFSVTDTEVKDVYIGTNPPSLKTLGSERAVAIRFAHPQPVALRLSLLETGAWTLISSENTLFTVSELSEGVNRFDLFPGEQLLVVVPLKSSARILDAGQTALVASKSAARLAWESGEGSETDRHNQGMLRNGLLWMLENTDVLAWGPSAVQLVALAAVHPHTGRIMGFFEGGVVPDWLGFHARAILAVGMNFEIRQSQVTVGLIDKEGFSASARKALERVPMLWREVVATSR